MVRARRAGRRVDAGADRPRRQRARRSTSWSPPRPVLAGRDPGRRLARRGGEDGTPAVIDARPVIADCARWRRPSGPSATTLREGARVLPRHGRHRALDGLHLLPGGAVYGLGRGSRDGGAARRTLAADIQTLPEFLDELEPTMVRLGSLADESTPVLSDLGANAEAINSLVRRLGPFSQAAIPAVDSLGEAAKTGTPAVTDARPVIADLRALANAVRPVGDEPARGARVLPRHRRHRAPDGLHLLPSGRDQRVRRGRPLPARRADGQPVRDLRDRAGRGLLGELPGRPARLARRR